MKRKVILGICAVFSFAIITGSVSFSSIAEENSRIRPEQFIQKSYGNIVLDEGGMRFYAEDITYLQSKVASLFNEIDDYKQNVTN